MHKNQLLTCESCKKSNFVNTIKMDTGYFDCSVCGRRNNLRNYFYDTNILLGLPSFGEIVCGHNSSERYPLKLGINIIGVGELASLRVRRMTHSDKCFISRVHCSLHVGFDERSGLLHYRLEDGSINDSNKEHRPSKNGTYYGVNNIKIELKESIFLSNNERINLGGLDHYILKHYRIPEAMLDTYKKYPQSNLEDTTDNTQ